MLVSICSVPIGGFADAVIELIQIVFESLLAFEKVRFGSNEGAKRLEGGKHKEKHRLATEGVQRIGGDGVVVARCSIILKYIHSEVQSL